MCDDSIFYVKFCRMSQTTRKPSPVFECISQFSEISKNVKIVPLFPHFPYCFVAAYCLTWGHGFLFWKLHLFNPFCCFRCGLFYKFHATWRLKKYALQIEILWTEVCVDGCHDCLVHDIAKVVSRNNLHWNVGDSKWWFVFCCKCVGCFECKIF